MTAPTPSDPSKWLTDLLAGQQEMFRILGGGAEPAEAGAEAREGGAVRRRAWPRSPTA